MHGLLSGLRHKFEGSQFHEHLLRGDMSETSISNNSLPVANLLTISEAGSTSEMSKGFLANLICSCPRSVQERTYNKKIGKVIRKC